MSSFNSNGNETLNSTTLAALVVPPDIAPGTKIWNVGVGAYFTYESPNTDALDPDVVVAVAGITGARWIVAADVALPITNAELATMAAHTWKGNNTTATAVPIDATGKQLLTDVNSQLKYTRTTLDTAGVSMAVTGLTGNSDGGYRIDFYANYSTNHPGLVKFQVNDTDCEAGYLYAATSTAGAGNGTTFLLTNDGGLGTMRGTIYIDITATGQWRFIRSVQTMATASFSNTWDIWTSGRYADSTTEITKVSILSQNPTSLDVGSWIQVTRLCR